jgi:hypothetical protein
VILFLFLAAEKRRGDRVRTTITITSLDGVAAEAFSANEACIRTIAEAALLSGVKPKAQ